MSRKDKHIEVPEALISRLFLYILDSSVLIQELRDRGIQIIDSEKVGPIQNLLSEGSGLMHEFKRIARDKNGTDTAID